MPDAYFAASPAGLQPRPHAQGPWSPEMLHGRLLGGLAARAVEARAGGGGFVPSRLTVDLFRAAPMAPVQVEAELVRDGRRIRVVDATILAGGDEVGRARAVLLRAGEAPPGRVWQPPRWSPPEPEGLPAPDVPGAGDGAWLFRQAEGGFGTSERSRVWTCDTAALVEGEDLSPFVRAAVSADAASPMANSGDDGLHYINADYSLFLARLPVGEWVALESDQHLAADGIALGTCTLYDRAGPFGTSTTTALANPPLRPGDAPGAGAPPPGRGGPLAPAPAQPRGG